MRRESVGLCTRGVRGEMHGVCQCIEFVSTVVFIVHSDDIKTGHRRFLSVESSGAEVSSAESRVFRSLLSHKRTSGMRISSVYSFVL